MSPAHGRPADHELDPVLCLDDPGLGALLFLWPEAQYPKSSESRVRGIAECIDGLFSLQGDARESRSPAWCSSFPLRRIRARGEEAGPGSSSKKPSPPRPTHMWSAL